jgi:hypothetical protein
LASSETSFDENKDSLFHLGISKRPVQITL